MSTAGIVLVALVIAVGLVAVVLPVLPGIVVVWGAIAVWALVERTTAAWLTLGVVTALLTATSAVKYVWPMRRMRRAEVPTSSLVAGAVLGIVGFFVVPVLGLVIGFVSGVFLAELAHRRDHRLAWGSTVHALTAVALSTGIELAGALLAAGVWLVAVALS